MASVPSILQWNHIITQNSYNSTELLPEIDFELDGASNGIYLPVSNDLASELGVTAHNGRTLISSFDQPLINIINALGNTADGQLALGVTQGTEAQIAAAAQRLTTEAGNVLDALKFGLANGDLFTSSTGGIGRAANALVFGVSPTGE